MVNFDPKTLQDSLYGPQPPTGQRGLAPFPPTTSTNGWTMVDQVVIDDNTVHTYRTDPKFIYQARLGYLAPPLQAWAIWVYNQTEKTLTAQPIQNVMLPVGYPANPASATNPPIPDVEVGSPRVLAPDDDTIIAYPFANAPVEYLSLALSFDDAPTEDLPVSAVLYLYYGSGS